MKKIISASLCSLLSVSACAHRSEELPIKYERKVEWRTSLGSDGFTVYADFSDGTKLTYSYLPFVSQTKKGVAWALIQRPNESDKKYEFDVVTDSTWKHKVHKLEYGPEPTICSPKEFGAKDLKFCSKTHTSAMMHYYNKYSKMVPLTTLLDAYRDGKLQKK